MRQFGAPDLTAFMTYAGPFDPVTQAGSMMRLYKNPQLRRGAAWQTVTLLAALGLIAHVDCPGRLLGAPLTAWATVPSLPPKAHLTTHPLNSIARGLARPGAHEVPLTAARDVALPRAINADHFTADPVKTVGHHVLLIEDTWTGGGHATSAALALDAAGATHVSVLVIARWLSLGWEATTPGWAKTLTRIFDAEVCPWTQGACP